MLGLLVFVLGLVLGVAVSPAWFTLCALPIAATALAVRDRK